MIKPRFYNSLTKQYEPFEPRDRGKARVYHCGPTVYQRQHIGNMRRYLFADFLRRSLELLGYEVREIMNITDVGHMTLENVDSGEDKIEKAAAWQKKTPGEIADEQIALFNKDLKAVSIRPAHAYPRATHHIEQMQKLIYQLIEKRHAYQINSGIYFDVKSWPGYGRLSGNTLEQLEAGRRIEVRQDKKHPADFALWKLNDKDHLQQWDSPWGRGYPGWHIECSAMSLQYLGDDIDIHTGGEDNRFPHHENEIAQAEGATGKTFVRLWLHNAWLQYSGKKMAKSEGGTITLDDITKKGHSPLAFRLLVFGSHYRQKIDFTWEALESASRNLETIKQLIRRLKQILGDDFVKSDGRQYLTKNKIVDDFKKALADDLNTAKALALVMAHIGRINKCIDQDSPNKNKLIKMWSTLLVMDRVLGVIEITAQVLEDDIPTHINELVAQREKARLSGDFDRADKTRIQIEELGYQLEDTDKGPRIIKG